MTDHPKPLPQLAGVNAYVPGEAPKNVDGKSYKLASNENPLGASPRAKQVYADLAAKLELYPDGAARELKAALAKKHGLDPARLVLGAGSDDIFLMLGRAMKASARSTALRSTRSSRSSRARGSSRLRRRISRRTWMRSSRR
jgi:histidinol-phosphate/aromatic aminotransferase/cobyric acid decarboxylase-like protein